MSREALFPASCSAAIAAAAVTPPPGPPALTSLLAAVSFISSIFELTTERYTPSSGWQTISLSLRSSISPSTSTIG